MNHLGLPMRHEESFRVDGDDHRLWEYSHDPATQTVVIKYELGLFAARRDIDALASVVAGDLHGIAARLHPNRSDES